MEHGYSWKITSRKRVDCKRCAIKGKGVEWNSEVEAGKRVDWKRNAKQRKRVERTGDVVKCNWS